MDTTQEPSVVVTVPDSHVEAMASLGVPWVSRPLRLRRANREDVIRVPARLEDWLPPDHPARQVWETVKSLDLSGFYVGIQVEDGTPGAPATDPLILVAVWALRARPAKARHVPAPWPICVSTI
jgi:hypothetical protein